MFQRDAYLLAGPTASGKTGAVAILARELGAAVLCADSMSVYRGFDIGTAKPTPAEREGYATGGIDLADPCEEFSAGAWLRAAADFAASLPSSAPLIVSGGTGLYFSALLRGLDRKWADPPPACPVLDLPREELRARAARRIDAMLAAGWPEEVASLARRFPCWSRTASYAIGYAEIRAAYSFPEGSPPVPPPEPAFSAMKERMLVRTMRLVKHQATWFRHQMRAVPVPASDDPAETARRVRGAWRACGPAKAFFPDPGELPAEKTA